MKMARNSGDKPMVIRPSYYDDEESEDGLENVLQGRDEEESQDDEMATISFGALNAAQSKLDRQAGNTPKRRKSLKRVQGSGSDSDSDSDSESDFFDDNDNDSNNKIERKQRNRPGRMQDQKKKNKHAPSETSAKKPVSKVRDVAGLENKSMYRDIRFDAAYGKADLEKVRKDYSFLDEYRQNEVQDMQLELKKGKNLSYFKREKLQHKIQSLKSRLDTLNNRDLETKILSDHKKAQVSKFKSGEQTNPYFLKKSDKRKLIQKAKFENMKSSQREKVMERKRKRRLGKEFKELEFNRH